MAEICCDVASSVDPPSTATTATAGKRARVPAMREASTSAFDAGSRSARRRRMELRRFKIDSSKRQRCDSGGEGAAEGGGDPTSSAAPAVAAGDARPRFGVSSVCGRRRDMEDATAARVDFLKGDGLGEGNHHFFGVYDGHGCSHVAAACRDRMHEVVSEEMEALRLGAPPTQAWWRFVMERGFARMDGMVTSDLAACLASSPECRCELRLPKCDHVGSTAVVAVVNSSSIVVANCGDSRAVLCRGGVAVPLSSDHKPDRPDELQRIEAAGGRVIDWDGPRVLGVLAMSRAIGDAYLKPYVISEPEVKVTERTADDEFLILASDGLWDVVSNEMACGIVRMCLRGNQAKAQDGDAIGVAGAEADGEAASKACSDAAILLTKVAMARQSADNVSVVIVDLRRCRSSS